MNPTKASTQAPWPEAPAFVIDDDLHWLEIMRKALTSLGWNQVRTLSEPGYAAQLAGEFRPAVVLLDLVMAEKDGRQVLRELRAQQPDLPIVVVTGKGQVDVAVACMRDGAKDYLIKPPTRQHLERTLRQVLAPAPAKDAGARRTSFQEAISELPVLPNVKEVPDMLVQEALRRSQGVVKTAAQMIGISSQAVCNRKRRAFDKG